MGYDSGASLWVGLRIQESNLYREKKVPGCACAFASKLNFCSQCGAPRWKGEDVPFEGFDEDMEHYRGLPVGRVGSCESGERIIGKRLGKANRREHLRQIDGGALFKEEIALRELLEEAPFFDRACFGVWLVFDESY